LGEKGSDFLQNNFLSVWHHFLLFEIERSKAAVKAWGNANGYLVFQVIAWHHVVILTAKSDSKFRDDAVQLWYKYSKTGFETNSVLTYTLISELTSLSIETVRRQVKKLVDNNWVAYSKKNGVTFNPSEENNNYLANTFNKKEVDNLGDFLDLIVKRKFNLSN
tara:strand:+ start:62 stop:550 length:489 start_codon:yes stop_codon:yes gene_type:complete